MKVLITGSSGMVGTALRAFLGRGGHQVRRLLRGASASDDATSWNPADGRSQRTPSMGSTQSSTWPVKVLPAVDGRRPARLGFERAASPALARCARRWRGSTRHQRRSWRPLRSDSPATEETSSSTSRRARGAGFCPRCVRRGRPRSHGLASEAFGSCICVSGSSSALWAEHSRKCCCHSNSGSVGSSVGATST